MTVGCPPSADHFDLWYANMVESPARDEIVQRHLGLPADVLSRCLLAWDAIAEVIAVCGRRGKWCWTSRAGAAATASSGLPEALHVTRGQPA